MIVAASLAVRDIDWQAPWLAPYLVVGEPLTQLVLAGIPCSTALNSVLPSAPVHFVPQGELPAGMAYEQFIFENRRVPTRDGLHDFFNGLSWLHFPQTKRRLNTMQAQQIAAAGIGGVRGCGASFVGLMSGLCSWRSALRCLCHDDGPEKR